MLDEKERQQFIEADLILETLYKNLAGKKYLSDTEVVTLQIYLFAYMDVYHPEEVKKKEK